MVTLNLDILNRHAKFEGKWTRANTKNSNEKSIIDYAVCSKTLSKDFMKVLIDDQETYKIKGKNKSDHNTFIIEKEKTVNNNKIHPKYSWKINNNTNWNTYKNVIENEIEYNPPGNYQELEQIVHSTTMKTIGMCKDNCNQIYNNKNIKTSTKARQQKHTAKKELQQAIITKNNIEIKLKNNQYRISQENLKKIITHYETEAAQKKLNNITENEGTNSKNFWNLLRSIKRNNTGYMYAITTEDGWRFFSENDIKEQTAIYYQNLYTPRTSPPCNHSWTNFIEQQITIYGKNKQHEKEFYIREITIQEVKKATKTLKNNNSIWPELIKNEFIKYGGKKRLEKLTYFLNKVFNHEQIPQSWLRSMIINIDKSKKNKVLSSSKRGISLSNNICKLFERVINNRIKGTLQFTEAQAGAKENRAAVGQLFTLKAKIQNRTSKGLPTYIAFIDLEKAFHKTWVQGVFFNLWNRGIKDKIWRIMLKLKQNRKPQYLPNLEKQKK